MVFIANMNISSTNYAWIFSRVRFVRITNFRVLRIGGVGWYRKTLFVVRQNSATLKTGTPCRYLSASGLPKLPTWTSSRNQICITSCLWGGPSQIVFFSSVLILTAIPRFCNAYNVCREHFSLTVTLSSRSCEVDILKKLLFNVTEPPAVPVLCLDDASSERLITPRKTLAYTSLQPIHTELAGPPVI